MLCWKNKCIIIIIIIIFTLRGVFSIKIRIFESILCLTCVYFVCA